MTEQQLKTLTRSQLIQWLMSNDPNGCYSDEQSKGEGLAPIIYSEALTLALNQLEESNA